jgi:amino acid adenylation domain-containing protein
MDSAISDRSGRRGADLVNRANSLPDLFREVTSWRAQHPALVECGRTISYITLDEASDRLAARLLARGVEPGQRVGLLAQRGAGMPLGILAILKSGASYVPLDPGYPLQRLRFMADDADLAMIVGDPALAADIGLTRLPVVSMEEAAGSDVPTSLPVIRKDDPAYVIYTSGSTGKPKGCVVTHGNVLSVLRSVLPLLDVSAADRWALFHSVSFDVSVAELWAAIATGASAVVVPSVVARSPMDLITQLERDRVTVLAQVPSVFRSVVLAYTEAACPPLCLRYLLFAGESIDIDVVNNFLGHVKGTSPTIVNLYGPTETTIYATARVLTADDLTRSAPGAIGWPLPHLEIQIRGDQQELLADGEAGELWIAGEGVSNGYLARPDLTAERFVVLEGPDGPRRCYRTGDLARKLADGSIDFLGRKDEQIKHRGYRIEPGEIEAALRSHESIRDSAVTVTTAASGAQFLTAFLVTEESASQELAGQLRKHATAILPGYMVPDRYRVVAELPLNSSGKLDRRSLANLSDESA